MAARCGTEDLRRAAAPGGEAAVLDAQPHVLDALAFHLRVEACGRYAREIDATSREVAIAAHASEWRKRASHAIGDGRAPRRQRHRRRDRRKRRSDNGGGGGRGHGRTPDSDARATTPTERLRALARARRWPGQISGCPWPVVTRASARLAGSPAERATIVRQWQLLTLLPRAPRRIDSGTLGEGLRGRGLDVHRRTVQRDLVELARVCPDERDEADEGPPTVSLRRRSRGAVG
jgi:hypothetical protein